MAARVALAWVVTWPVAMLFRWLLVDRLRNPALTLSSFLTFAVVALIFNLLVLMIWRVPFAMNNSFRQRESSQVR